MHEAIDEIIFSREQIAERVKELAAQVTAVFREDRPTVAVVLNGAFIFAADLVRHLPQDVEVVFVRVSSYGSSTAPESAPRVDLPAGKDWTGDDVLVIEDIVDTGRSVKALAGTIRDGGAATVRICAFLDKPARREVEVEVDFLGFTVEGNDFVVGYGLDLGGRYRNQPFVGTLKPEFRGD